MQNCFKKMFHCNFIEVEELNTFLKAFAMMHLDANTALQLSSLTCFSISSWI